MWVRWGSLFRPHTFKLLCAGYELVSRQGLGVVCGEVSSQVRKGGKTSVRARARAPKCGMPRAAVEKKSDSAARARLQASRHERVSRWAPRTAGGSCTEAPGTVSGSFTSTRYSLWLLRHPVKMIPRAGTSGETTRGTDSKDVWDKYDRKTTFH